MYDMIGEIPPSFRLALEKVAELKVPRRDRAVFTGNGSAFYSAWMGSQVVAGTGFPCEAVPSFELERYRKTSSRDLVVGVSHSGITKSTVDSVRAARGAGAFTVGVTHFEGRPIQQVCDLTAIIGNGPDQSRCHTKTYVDSAAAVAKIGLVNARLCGYETEDYERKLQSVGDQIGEVVAESDSWARGLVDRLPALNQVVFTGAGPNVVTAREAALKIKESSYLPSEGIELEEEMHGSWVNLDSSSLLVVIAPPGPSTARATDILAAARKLGVGRVAVGDSSLGADSSFVLPQTDEVLTPFLAIVPLYFVAYYLSVRLGHNPDYLRYLEPSYWEARKDIFPPGTH
jgi:glucosamine--fructose-6-phosphate aminotransferase (isomerizing)